jgi:hypothetical protein
MPVRRRRPKIDGCRIRRRLVSTAVGEPEQTAAALRRDDPVKAESTRSYLRAPSGRDQL